MATKKPARKYHSLRDERQVEVLSKHMMAEDTQHFIMVEESGFERKTRKYFFYKDKMYFHELETDRFYFYRATALEIKLFNELKISNAKPIIVTPKYEPGSLMEAYATAATLPAEQGEALIEAAKKKFGLS